MALKGTYHTEGALTGLHPVKNDAGTAPQVNDYAVSATYAVTIGEGNIVGLSETGVILANSSATVATLLGVAASNLAATPGAGAVIKIYDDPEQQYYASLDAVVSNTIIVVGRFTAVTSNVYNATLGYGKTSLSVSDITSLIAAGDIVQILGFPTDVGETKAATYAQARVKLASHWNVQVSTIKTTHLT